ncbi:LysR family transcriptional regulator (chromosome initiation inhibitor) [Diaminobutyricimonas aerilata]|uniref:LysR family transcriptional regulator (Chromosome initiation inhibitor) n=1 Tax=Diaminobutyricimonas aerilata TaxID=1162967 RepID=A0A2M9CL42_9MICO|nr:ArgP/LysG family DNA-binding transcriptional regulator [Diaminobutyricimonas aerilata]PJJ72613.1 LysR family transcriptional regulator (chromosome initiation inhibitor) [Diaminobutyricimonas aerilata]
MQLHPEQLRALAAIADEGSFEAAAARLGVTPSAVSQRMRALETEVGRVVVRRSRPVQLTDAGRLLVRHARQLALLDAELAAAIGPSGARPRVTVVVNADSLATWALDAFTPLDGVSVELLREDQAHSLEPLRDGTAMAAITSEATPVAGCTSEPLGVMRYRPLATPAFAERWFADGRGLADAPIVVFDRKDDLQDLHLRRRRVDPALPPRSYVPSSHDFLRAVELGMGWGMLPDEQSAEALAAGRLVRIDGDRHLDVALHWQQWRLRSAPLDAVAAAVRAASSVLRDSPVAG